MIDVVHEINAVQRQVGTRRLDAGEARTITISRVYEAPADDLWDAVTNPERIPRWFLPVSGELRVGGRYEIHGNASGTIERCDPPHSFAATWELGGDVSWIEVRVTPEDESRTRLVLEHIAHVGDERWAQFGPGALGVGWDLALARGLAAHLSSGASVDPHEAMAWTASEEGRQFIVRSSEAWGVASIAAGTERTAAEAAAERTTSFYTPPEA
jgi:uncharacterized protein YndB with AHSA1/START domain